MATDGLTNVRKRAAAAAVRAGRSPDDVTIVAVSKTVGPAEIEAAYQAGHRDFGENRSHELAAKARIPHQRRRQGCRRLTPDHLVGQ